MNRLKLFGGGVLALLYYFLGLGVAVLMYAFIGYLADVAYDHNLWIIGAPLRLVALVFILSILFGIVMLAWGIASTLWGLVSGKTRS